MTEQKRFMLIACAVLYRECYYCAAQCRNIVDIQLCEKSLHDIGAEKMSARLQVEIDKVPSGQYDAILLAYGLCNNGTMGLRADIPIVLPRAHDCITLLMGSKEKYRNYFDQNPGTYFQSSGWLEREESCMENPESTVSRMGISTYDEYVRQYGEENAKFIMETMGGGLENYTKMAFIDTGVGDSESYRHVVPKLAAEKSWAYEEIKGSTNLLIKLLEGDWDEADFLVIPAGENAEPSHDDGIVRIKPGG